ncbi:MAG: hypothetical protein ACI9TA_001186, partial [Reinekea sp.]
CREAAGSQVCPQTVSSPIIEFRTCSESPV